MTNILEQEESIAFLKKIKVVPQKAYAQISEKNGTKLVLRQYKIEELDNGYNMVNISYVLNIKSDLITFYSVYLTSDKTDNTLCLCMSEKNKYNTLFNNILLLEDNVWKYCLVEGSTAVCNIEEYKSLIFETNNRSYIYIANAVYDKRIVAAFLTEYSDFIDVNKVIPLIFWKTFLSSLTKLLTI